MGVEDSPLRNRVVFVEGAPRSGTTMLISLIAAHPEIAAIVSESHFFDWGADRLFDNHERDSSKGSYLASYLSREELRDAVRDLFDRVLSTMRERVNPGAELVAEKTPAQPEDYAKALARKLECYPDARYVHVVRDREGVVQSLARAPWARGSAAEFTERWSSAVETVRSTLDGKAAYLEIPYIELANDPPGAMVGVFEWLGLASDAEVLERVAAVSRERISTHGPGQGDDSAGGGRPKSVRGRVATLPRRAARRIRGRGADAAGESAAEELMVALRDGNRSRVADLTGDDLLLELRSGAGDLRVDGEAARTALLELGESLFSGKFISESWSSSTGGASTHMLVSAVRGDGSRTDAAISAIVRDGRVLQITVISAGDPGGRPPEEWVSSKAG